MQLPLQKWVAGNVYLLGLHKEETLPRPYCRNGDTYHQNIKKKKNAHCQSKQFQNIILRKKLN